MDEKKREIVTQATAVYMKYGIKSVTMDEMASQLGVSKKTLYQFVKDKNDLVEQCVYLAHEGEVCCIAEINKKYENAIDEMLEISKYVSGELRKVHPSIFFDLAKYHPSALKIMTSHKQEFIKGCVIDNLQRGIKQGYYRKNLDVEVLSTIYLAIMDHIMLGDLFSHHNTSLEHIYQIYFRYHLRGIASDKGNKYINELTQNEKRK